MRCGARALRPALSVLCVCLLLGGCLQTEWNTVLYPDGAGKLTLRVAHGRDTAGVVQGFGQTGRAPSRQYTDPDELDRATEGFAAWTRPVVTPDGDWVRVTLTGYFEDVNRVRLYEIDPETKARKPGLAFTLRRAASGAVLEIQDAVPKDLAAQIEKGATTSGGSNPAQIQGTQAMAKQMLRGYTHRLQLTAPGAVTVTGPMAAAGRTATFTIDDQALGDLIDRKPEAIARFAGSERFTVTWTTSEVAAAEVQAFQQELAAAKARWPALREELRRQAAHSS